MQYHSLYRQVHEEEKRTVGGLLLFFCVIRTIVAPVYLVIRYAILFEIFGGVTQVLSRSPILLVLIGLEVVLAALGIWAGVLIWRLNVVGVRLAKLYLVLAVALPMAAGFGFQALGEGGLAQALGAAARGAIFFNVLWFIYLSISERVKNIYEIESERRAVA